mgnify:FL=1
MKKITLLAAFFVAFTMNAQLLNEGFDDITTLVDYTVLNVSDIPNTDFFQGNTDVFIAHSGANDSFLATNFEATSGSTIDLYIILPALELENGDELTFYTRAPLGSIYPDRLEVRIDPDGSGENPTSENTGSYTELLLEINPSLLQGGYPGVWALQTVIVSGLTGPTTTRLAFRYWVTDGGSQGENSDYIGIDTMEINETLSVSDESFNNFNYYTANNKLFINASTSLENIELYNLLGQEVFSKSLSNTNETINIASLETGIYVAKVSIDGKSKSFKIVKN